MRGDVVVDQRAERRGQFLVGASQRRRVLAVDEDRAVRRLAGARQADADVGGLRLAGAVHDAAHHRQRERLDALVPLAPRRHLLAHVVLHPLGEFLEGRARRAPAARARRDARREGAQPQRLQQLLAGVDLLAPVAARPRRQRDADGVADALGQQDADGRRRPDEPLHAHAGLGEAEVQRLVGLARQLAIHARRGWADATPCTR